MKDKGITPYVRNNYFKGKQLTVRDFQDEQSYHISKLRTLRGMNFGCGVAAGLDVVAVDGSTVSVEAGCAYDHSGREILVAEPVLKDIRTIDGFSGLEGSRSAYLCIEYAQTLLEEVCPVTDSASRRFNRIGEGYRLFLMNTQPRGLSNGLLSVIYDTKELISSPDFSVRVSVPRFVNLDEKIVITVTVEKTGLENLSVDFTAEYGVSRNDNKNTADFSYSDTANRFDIRRTELVITPPQKIAGHNKLSIDPENVKVKADDLSVTVSDPLEFDVEIIEESVRERVLREYFRMDAELSFSGSQEYLCLAELSLSCADDAGNPDAVFIERIEPLPFRQYIMSERLSYLLDNLPEQPESSVSEAAALPSAPPPQSERKRFAASGVENIDIDVDYRGRIYYSSEIMHGLGKGDISYCIGFEPTNGNDGAVVYGSPELFEGSAYNLKFPKVQYSVISYNDKGTFRIAVKLLERVNAGNIRIHWQAVRASEPSEKALMEIERISISVEPNFVTLAPRESITLECIIEGCENQNCIWNVETPNGGTISQNGVYNAPSSEGVYNVTATSVKFPIKKAMSRIVVEKKREL